MIRCARRIQLARSQRFPVSESKYFEYVKTAADDPPWPHNPPRLEPITYANASVDIDRANRTKKRIKYLAHKTFNRGVLSKSGALAACFPLIRPNTWILCWFPA